MKTRALTVVVLALLLAVTGCFPRKRVTWSPDGRWAAVLGGDGLRLCDPVGKLSPPVAENVPDAAWLPDSQRLLIVRAGEVLKTWPEAAALLAPERREVVTAAAERLIASGLREYEHWDEANPEPMYDAIRKSLAGLSGGEAAAAIFYIGAERAGELPQRLNELWHLDEAGGAITWVIQRAEVRQASIHLGEIIHRTLEEPSELRISADGQTVAFLISAPAAMEFYGDNVRRLCVLPVEGGAAPRVVADLVGKFPDWSADGRYLAFARTVRWPEKDQLVLGSIARRQVRDADGRLLEEFPEPEDLAGVVFSPELKVRCLPDGRILFASLEVHLPATAADMPPRALMFAVNPGQNPVVMRLIPRQFEEKIPNFMYAFEVSPDGRWASLPGGGGEVSVLSLATGEIQRVVEEFGLKGEILMLPTWRSADELCCLGPGPSGSGRAAVNLLKLDPAGKPGETIALSTDWPESVARGFLFKESEPESQPAGGAPVSNPS